MHIGLIKCYYNARVANDLMTRQDESKEIGSLYPNRHSEKDNSSIKGSRFLIQKDQMSPF